MNQVDNSAFSGNRITLKDVYWAIAIFCVAFFVHQFGASTLPFIDYDEAWHAQSALEMLQRGDYWVPTFGGAAWYDKLPGIYWLIALAINVVGKCDLAARLPAILSSALSSSLIYLFCARFFSRRTGGASTAIFTASPLVLIYSKLAYADLPLLLACFLLTWSCWELIAGNKPSLLARIIFVISLAGGLLLKGPVIYLVFSGLLIFIYWIDPQRSFPRHWIWQGLFSSFALIAIWLIPASLKTQGDIFHFYLFERVLKLSQTAVSNQGPLTWGGYIGTLPFYIFVTIVGFFPWSLYFIRAFSSKHRRLFQDIKLKFLIWSVVPVFVVFTLARTKSMHYLLPAFPVLSILAAHFMTKMGVTLKRVIVISVIVIMSHLILFHHLFPMIRSKSIPILLIQSLKNWDTPNIKFFTVGYSHPQLIWYLNDIGVKKPEPIDIESVSDKLNMWGARACLIRGVRLTKDFPIINPNRAIIPIKGRNFEIIPIKGRNFERDLDLFWDWVNNRTSHPKGSQLNFILVVKPDST